MSYLERRLLVLELPKDMSFGNYPQFIRYHRYFYSLIYWKALLSFYVLITLFSLRIAFISYLSCFTELNTNILKFTLMQLT